LIPVNLAQVKYVSIDDRRIAYREAGSGPGRGNQFTKGIDAILKWHERGVPFL
jgi:hypothetical protein